MVPKILHRIWLGPKPLPVLYDSFWRQFQVLHPGWILRTWTDAALLSDYPQLAQVHAWQTTESGRSNVLRYAILHALGGVYVDADIEPLRPLDELLDGRPFAGWEDKSAICTAVMASPAGHPAAAALVDGLYEHARWRRGAASNMQTGPYYLTQTWQGRPDVRLLPPAAFYPVHWSAKNNLRPPYPPESYVAHHWAASWT